MTSTTDSRTGLDYTTAIAILPTLAQTSPDDDCQGMVSEVSPADLRHVVTLLRDAGYEVSDSRDDEGRCWVWVIRRAVEV